MAVQCLRCFSPASDGDLCCPECGAPLPGPEAFASGNREREVLQAEADLAGEALAVCTQESEQELVQVRTETRDTLSGTATRATCGFSPTRGGFSAQMPPEHSSVNSVGSGWGKDPIDLAIDVLRPCVVGNNTLRVYLMANRGQFEDVVLKIRPHISAGTELEQVCGTLSADDESCYDCERIFTIENLPEGTLGCDILLRFAYNGVYRQYTGQIEINVNRREDLLDVVRQNINIHYNPQTTVGNVAQAGDVKVLHKSDGGIGKALENIGNVENPMSIIDRMSRAGDRTYRRVIMRSTGGSALTPPPAEAKVRELELALGHERVQFFVDDIICIGHSVNNVRYSDIVIDAPETKPKVPYDRISRIHCMIRHYGADVEICDGRIDVNGQIVPSSNGTMLNSMRLPPCSPLPLCDGEIRLGSSSGAVRLGVRLTPPAGCDQCKITEGERVSCAGGKRPCVVISRPDNLTVKYVALWSCFDLGNINRNYKGVVIFHYNGAFGWRRGRKSGWLTDSVNFGSSQFGKVTVSPVWDR